MGCFFTCFRFRDLGRRREPGSDSTPVFAKKADKFVARNQLASLFLCEEEDLICGSNTGQKGIDKELEHEIKFLKACGAISETPLEIRKVCKKTSACSAAESESRFRCHSTVSSDSCKRLECDERMLSSVKDKMDSSACNIRRSLSASHQLESKKSISLSFLLTNHENMDSPSTVGSILLEDAKDQHEVGSIQLEDDKDQNETYSSFGFDGLSVCIPQVDNGRKTDLKTESTSKLSLLSSSDHRVSYECMSSSCSNSPASTPLKLSDEMQTPGTVLYRTKLENLVSDKNAQVRTQYVYPVVSPIKYVSQLEAASDDSGLLKVDGRPDENREAWLQHSEIQMHQSPNQKTGKQLEMPSTASRKSGSIQESPILSLSQWLKPPVRENERGKWECNKKEISESDRDRPIIGTVAAHWNEDESFHLSPKWWDGNGIPNSTNKYKEDQRVNWHATPFEERLEKALSEDIIFPQRKLETKPISFEVEDEESDTAASLHVSSIVR